VTEPSPPPPKSLKEFNYFDDKSAPARTPAVLAALPSTPIAEERLMEYRKEGRRLAIRLGIALAAVVAVGWFVAGYRYWIAYVFSSVREPLQLGDVTTMRPEEIPHNGYVELTGITEHRGLSQKEVRGLSLDREEYWYFRLLGSRGVFIAVAGDPDKYGIVTQVTVSGRAVDPTKEACCDKVLDTYRERFHPREEGELRIIQVDVKPGEGRLPYLLLFLLFGGVVTSAAVAARRALKHATERHLAGLPIGLPKR